MFFASPWRCILLWCAARSRSVSEDDRGMTLSKQESSQLSRDASPSCEVIGVPDFEPSRI